MNAAMTVREAHDRREWDAFLLSRPFRPFLQSWDMGEVYRDIGEEPLRLLTENEKGITGIAQALVVPARRGKHLSLPYGPVWTDASSFEALCVALRKAAIEKSCSFVRMSPFVAHDGTDGRLLENAHGSLASPLHLLAEHVWHLPLKKNMCWGDAISPQEPSHTEEELLMSMRKTTRNLIRRAQKDGVTVRASHDPTREIEHFIALHDETKARHGFTPYSNAFFRAQVKRFSTDGRCTLYLAEFGGEVIAASIHMHFGGETSYHHGASTHRYAKVPASYLLQWTAITDALKRGDHLYSFWGIAPEGVKRHPFAGVTLFKTGFGGSLLTLAHCRDFPLKPSYAVTRGFEFLRKWKRGF